jgi:hypothetical protein
MRARKIVVGWGVGGGLHAAAVSSAVRGGVHAVNVDIVVSGRNRQDVVLGGLGSNGLSPPSLYRKVQ